MSKQEETRDRVLDLVESLEVGQPIPAERLLAVDLGVSRLTLRAALDELVRDGYLDRRHGSGTYVTEPKIAQPLTLTSFSDDMRRRGMSPGSQTLELTTVPAGARLAHRLGVSPESRLVRVKRLRLADRTKRPAFDSGLFSGSPTGSRWRWRSSTSRKRLSPA